MQLGYWGLDDRSSGQANRRYNSFIGAARKTTSPFIFDVHRYDGRVTCATNFLSAYLEPFD